MACDFLNPTGRMKVAAGKNAANLFSEPDAPIVIASSPRASVAISLARQRSPRSPDKSGSLPMTCTLNTYTAACA